MENIELKQYSSLYLNGVIKCLKRNYNRFNNMMDLDVYKFLKPLITYSFSEEYSYNKGNYGYVLLANNNVVGFFGMIYYRVKSEKNYYTVANPTTWAIDDGYRMYIFQVTEKLFSDTDVIIDATPSYTELTIETKMFGFNTLSQNKVRFFEEDISKYNYRIKRMEAPYEFEDNNLYKRFLDNISYDIKSAEIINKSGEKSYVIYQVVYAKEHLEGCDEVCKLARILSVSNRYIFNDAFMNVFGYIKQIEDIEALECDSMFIDNDSIYELPHEEKQFTRIIKYNKECDFKNWDLLYTEITLRNEY